MRKWSGRGKEKNKGSRYVRNVISRLRRIVPPTRNRERERAIRSELIKIDISLAETIEILPCRNPFPSDYIFLLGIQLKIQDIITSAILPRIERCILAQDTKGSKVVIRLRATANDRVGKRFRELYRSRASRKKFPCLDLFRPITSSSTWM